MLYIVGTAIGNIEDTSLRAARVLSESDFILVEDSSSFSSYYKRLLEIFQLSPSGEQKVIHFHDKNEFEKIPEVLELLRQNKSVSLVSQAGMPTIADPGLLLIKHCIKNNLPFTTIPGPTALTTALALSGFSSSQVVFLGFLPKKPSIIVQMFKQLNMSRSKHIKPTIVFYESPNRINNTLEIIAEVLPEADISVCREMTKKFEEVIRGKARELVNKHFKGELTVVLSPLP